MNKYNYQNNSHLLPNIHSYLTSNKINSRQNTAYIECFATYVLSRLVEIGKCPSFPYYYGSYSGIMPKYQYDITDEYGSVNKLGWFKKFKGNMFDIIQVSIEDEIMGELNDTEQRFKTNHTSLEIEKLLSPLDGDEISEISDISNESNDFSSSSTKSIISNLSQLEEIVNQKINQESQNKCDCTNDIIGIELTEENINLVQENENIDLVRKGKIEKDKGIEKDKEIDDLLENQVEDLLDLENISIEVNSIDISNDDSDISEDDISNFSSMNSDSSLSGIEEIGFGDDIVSSTYFAQYKDYPVQILCTEYFPYTLDELIDNGYKINQIEWAGILFQICFGLAVAQKHLSFTHNDLHSSNVMFNVTKYKYLYFCIEGQYYRIPTFNRLVKIIDFARGIFKIGKKKYFSDVFSKDGDAETQYSYPYRNNYQKCRHKPNYSFDLSRFATTIKDNIPKPSSVYNLLKKWMTDKDGNNLENENEDFDLYVKIARNVRSAVPKKQFKEKIFNQFHIKRSKIPRNTYIYYL